MTNNKSDIRQRYDSFYQRSHVEICRSTDRLFVKLMIFQWCFGIVMAVFVSPRTWIGESSLVHIHVYAAIFLGAAIAALPVVLGILRPGEIYTRHVIATGQMLYSALLIHLTGGRIETHFHVFGSLAFLAFYRDWKVLIPATVVVALDHMIRGIYWPQSVFGVLTASPYRWIEHAAWVIFEDIFLIRSCLQSVREMKQIACSTVDLKIKNEELAEREVRLYEMNRTLDDKVRERTAQLEEALVRLVQSEKLASIGHLAAGVAHEINNPVGFVGGNIQTMGEYFDSLDQAVGLAERLTSEVEAGQLEEARKTAVEMDSLKEKLQIEYIRGDMKGLIQESKDGVDRIRKIVLDLRSFSREGSDEKQELARIEEIIRGVLRIVQSEVKYKADVIENFGETPEILCYPQKLSQVFVNLLVNACQAMSERGEIRITTSTQGEKVCVEVSDSGKGIPADKLSHIFDPFFTTKPVGEGTGLGLSVSYEIIKQHEGDMQVVSEVGKGTTFQILLPVSGLSIKE